MADNVEYVFTTNLAGVEDLLLGIGTVQQIRDGEIKSITKINAHQIPYTYIKSGTETIETTIGAALDALLKGETL